MFRKKTEEELMLKQNAKDKTIPEEERVRRDKVLREIYADPYWKDTPTDDEGASYCRPKELRTKISKKRFIKIALMVVGYVAASFLLAYLVECFIRFIEK